MSESLPRWVLLANLSSTLFMAGVIWFVQVVHYPLFASVGRAEFPAYEQRHSVSTTWVVAPPMFVEAVSAALLIWFRPYGISIGPAAIGAALVVLIWGSTAFLQVPCHDVLVQQFDEATHQRLVTTNWIRTVAWSLRGVLVFWMATAAMATK